ncbi:RodZ domain-containing protein [Pseudidiomarina donghaiensis]|uniref:DUF4115 domain-containing protein n=1 Tax=Pseudidiomarina donghaiensis TaxID=519452 RepID=A0A432XKQ5_9GAMM|nr:RodZ domain-containing protein [Pseudidiomarina donghaiensis]RUO49276.1 DUF4115 domain-containing protein [Pseudidiomarina donghaiensis]SFV20892.1 cytoskeleton protein RodZ [Pseudidiomarina donghaiensis]
MTPKDDLFEQNDDKGEGAAADQVEGQAAEQPEPYTGETPGQILRAAREAEGLSTQQVADSLRLRNAVVEIIEADDYDKLSSTTFVRGYLRSFSKALEVDEKRVFEAYRAMGFGEVAASTITMQSFSKRKVRERNDSRLMLISYLIIAIVIAMAVIWWWQDSQAGNNSQSLTEQVFGADDSAEQGADQASDQVSGARTPVTRRVTEDDVRSAIVGDAAGNGDADTDATDSATDSDAARTTSSNQVVIDTTASGGALTNADNQTADNSVSGEGATNNDAAQTVTEAPQNSNRGNAEGSPESGQVVSESPSATASSADQLVFTFSDACWIKVTDATDEVLAIGTKAEGYTMPLSGQAPFDIILCKPEAVSMTYNGEQVDLSGYRRNRSVTMTLN